MKTTKTNKNRKQCNVRYVTCAISDTMVPEGQAVCANIKSNGTTYYSKQEEAILQGTQTPPSLTNTLMTCVVLNATLINGTQARTRANYTPKETYYKIYFNNGVKLLLNGNNAQVKKYFNQLRNYKQAISKITYLNYNGIETETPNYKHNYPPYIRQKELYKYGLGYNPDPKTTTTKTW